MSTFLAEKGWRSCSPYLGTRSCHDTGGRNPSGAGVAPFSTGPQSKASSSHRQVPAAPRMLGREVSQSDATPTRQKNLREGPRAVTPVKMEVVRHFGEFSSHPNRAGILWQIVPHYPSLSYRHGKAFGGLPLAILEARFQEPRLDYLLSQRLPASRHPKR